MSARRRRPGLIVIWGGLIVLIGAIVVPEGPGLIGPSTTDPIETARLFDFTETELGGVQVVFQRRIASLMRGADGLWYQHDDSHSHGGVGAAAAAPGSDEAHQPNQAQSAAIADQIARAVDIPASLQDADKGALEAFGLTRSETMIAFYGRGPDGVDFTKPLSVLYLGDPNLKADAYYARRDGASGVALVPQAEIDALLKLVLVSPTPTSD